MPIAMPSRREFLGDGAAAMAALLGVLAGSGVHAQSPIETLQILSGAAAGSIPDTVARRIGEQLSGRHAQRVIVANRPGGAGQVAVNALKAAPGDGATMLLTAGSVATVHPYLYARLPYDPAVDLQPVSLAAEMPLALAVGPAVPDSVGSLREWIDWMRRNPTLANVGSPGVGTTPHLLETMLLREADVAWQNITYPGGAPMVVALLGGHIAAVALPEGILRPHRLAGKLRVLATSGPQRSRFMPDVPNLVESGFARLVVQEWFAFFMSASVPAATIDTASQALRLAIAQPELASGFAELGIVAASSTPVVLATRIAAEQRLWEPVIRSNGMRAE